ncbi:MAG: NADH:ubiquinone reductase (Na(+)-transporting) subunit F [Thermodesulfobacteriota bacterium]
MIYLVSLSVFTGVTLFLVTVLLFVKNAVSPSGKSKVLINEDESKKLEVSGSPNLLSVLVNNDILLPSACGGKGTCGMCKCRVTEGGGEILPTELTHVTRAEKADNVRLACQLKIKEDLKIEIPEEVFNIQMFDGEVVSNKNVSTYIKELVLKVENQDFKFKSGAYIQIEIPPYDTIKFSDFEIPDKFIDEWKEYGLLDLSVKSEEKEVRAYSLANPPEEKGARLTVRIATPPEGTNYPPGIGSSYTFSLKPGDKVQFSGPYGDFFIKDTQNEICFVGGGAGMAPMRSHILHLLETENTERKITFWYGARSLKELFYDDLFRELEEKYENFSFYVALSEPLESDEWDGMTGFIHKALYENYIKDHDYPEDIEYYLCGPPVMVDALREMLINEGVEEDMILYDAF